MAGQPKRRAKRGLDPKPWNSDPSLSTRPPFEPGNFMAVKSGVNSERIVSRYAGELAEWLVAEHRDLADPRYRFAVNAWARAETVAALLVRYLDSIDLVDAEGEVRDRLLSALRAAERRAAEERRNLGLDPSSHARLGRERAEAVKGAAGLEALVARGRRGIEARDRALRDADSVGGLREQGAQE